MLTTLDIHGEGGSSEKESGTILKGCSVAGLPGGRYGVLHVYWMRMYMTQEGQMAFSPNEWVQTILAYCESYGGEEKQTLVVP